MRISDWSSDVCSSDLHRLLRVAGVVADLQYDLLPENPAGRVDVGDRHRGAGPHLRAETRILTGHRTGRGDHDIGPCRRDAQRSRRRGREQYRPQTLHLSSPHYLTNRQKKQNNRSRRAAEFRHAKPEPPGAGRSTSEMLQITPMLRRLTWPEDRKSVV